MSDGRVEFEIKADNSSVSATISDTTNKLKAAAGQWESSTTSASNSSAMFSGILQGVGQTLGGIVSGAAKNAGKAVVEFGKECIAAASALNETKNVVDTVFGDNAAQIYSWAKSAQGAFGLTETQALKYTSTLGAMMKSSGLAQNEIGSMSTALAGLAADMASFYNMDFDTAFEKIRSGISGETEPLKQLGINLSVANLEAFALAQGIKKSYQEMSQAEQVALRYQYIMQATSDAQGDFQRTSDGYANSIRRIETAWESIKTTIGTALMVAVEPAVSALADLLTNLTKQPERTIFDTLNEIEVDYDAKLKEIEKTHTQARSLVEMLEELHQQATQPVTASGLSELIESLSTSIPGLYDNIQGKNPTDQISALASALSKGSDVSTDAWTTALTHYDEFAGALAEAMASDDPTAAIKALADELAKGSSIDAGTWEQILTRFAEALDTSDLKGKAESTSGTIEGLVTALAASIPDLNSKIQGKNPADQISTLASALAEGSSISVDAWTNAITHYEEFAGALADAMASDDPTGAIKDLADELARGSDIDAGTWESILSTFAGALSTADLSTKAGGAAGSIEGLVSALTTSIPGLEDAIKDKNPTEKISALADALAKGSGVSLDAWTTALTNYEGFSSELSAAMSAENPTEAIRALADELARGSDISVADWTTILTTFSGALQESTVGSDAASLKGEIDKLSDTLSMKTSVSASKWQTVFQEFDGYKADFFSALGSDNPQEKLNDLAKTLAGKVDGGLSAAEWNTALTTLAGYIKTGDENLNTAGIVGKLSGLTEAIQGAEGTSLKDVLSKYKTDAGTVDSNSIDAWTAVLGAFSTNFGSFKTAISNYTAGSNTTISGLASALSGIDGDEAKVNAWSTLLSLLAESGEEISSYYGASEQGFTGWIESVRDTINSIDPNNAEAWNSLFSLLAEGKFGNLETGPVEASLSGLAGEMETVYYASEEELIVLRALCDVFPGLTTIIDTQTGAVRGGIEAINDYIEASEAAAIKQTLINRQMAKENALQSAYEDYYTTMAEVVSREALRKPYVDAMAEIRSELEGKGVEFWRNEYGDFVPSDKSIAEAEGDIDGLVDKYWELQEAADAAAESPEKLKEKAASQKAALDEARAALDAENDALGINQEMLNSDSDATEEYTASLKEAQKWLTSLEKQLESIMKYQDKAINDVMTSLSKTVDGFNAVNRTAEEYKGAMSWNTMEKNLEDQLAFLEEYSGLLDTIKNKGVSDEIIAAVADGSVESLKILRGLSTATADEIETLNERYGQVQGKKQTLAEKVAAERLAVDKEYQAMIDEAVRMAQEMDQSGAAGENAAATMAAIVGAVAAGRSELSAEVEAVIALIAQLGQIGGFTVGNSLGGTIVGNTGGYTVGNFSKLTKPQFSNALGLDFVPYDGYVSELHRGEAVLTADEAALWRNFTGMGDSADQQAFDYDLLTASITSGIPSGGGNVYLDGRTVGKVISEGMGDSYRRLGRSGWRG